MNLEEGIIAVKRARSVIESCVEGEMPPSTSLPPSFSDKMGVFVTINNYPSKSLRGCIGFPEPIFPLSKALDDAARSAALEDPRFLPVKPKELDSLTIEVTILTPPVKIDAPPKERPQHVKIGEDGLIASRGFFRGLLLPQVPVEWGWDSEEFLSQTCVKAGLSPVAWLDEDTEISKFQGEIFSEERPKGEVKRITLN
jgi:hypothetical protein